MIDWFNVGANALWIIGCSVALATLSYASWQASMFHTTFRKQLGERGPQVSLDIAGLLFCLGLAGTSSQTWEIILWLVLAVLFIIQIVLAYIPKTQVK